VARAVSSLPALSPAPTQPLVTPRPPAARPQVLSLWMWLSLRFDETFFPGRERVARMMQQLCSWMNMGLAAAQAAGAKEAAEAMALAAGAQIATALEGVGSRRGRQERAPARTPVALAAAGMVPDGAATAASETAGAGSGNATAGAKAAALAVEQLMAEPEYHPTMTRFVRWTTSHRLVVPPPPRPDERHRGHEEEGAAAVR
jgi:hypothetical protein